MDHVSGGSTMRGNDLHDPQDKQWWLEAGMRREVAFVEQIAPQLGLQAEINPAKERDPYAPDLLVGGQLADLKCQTTPFFRAESFYGVPVRVAVTFNRVDYERYRELHPRIDLIWWVHWDQLDMRFRDGQVVRTAPLNGVWRVSFSALAAGIEADQFHLHEYIHRRSDTRGNARDSFVLDLREFTQLTTDTWQGPSPASFD
jgi:hypothetical protein